MYGGDFAIFCTNTLLVLDSLRVIVKFPALFNEKGRGKGRRFEVPYLVNNIVHYTGRIFRTR